MDTLQTRISSLIEQLGKDKSSEQAGTILAIVEIGEQACPALVEVLQGSNVKLRGIAATCLGNIWRPTGDAIMALVNGLNDEDAFNRSRMAWALGQIAMGSKLKAMKAGPNLINLLRDADSRVRSAAAFALGATREVAARSALTALLHESDLEVCQNATWAIGKVHADEAVPILLSLLGHDSVNICRNAAWALGQMGANAIVAVSALRSLTNHADPSVRSSVVTALGKIGAMKVVRTLLNLTRDEDRNVRYNAAMALMDMKAEKALIKLVRNARDVTQCRTLAIQALADAKSAKAVPTLTALLKKHPDFRVRSCVACALGDIGDPKTVPALVCALYDPSPVVCSNACFSLEEIQRNIDKIAEEASNQQETVWQAVGPALRQVVDQHKEQFIRVQAIQALEELEREHGPIKGSTVLPPISDAIATKLARIRNYLDTFCNVGKILILQGKQEQRGVESFVSAWMVDQLFLQYKTKIKQTTLRNHLEKVQVAFRSFSPELGEILDRGQGQRGFGIMPQFWEAWRMAMVILGQNPSQIWEKNK